MSTRQAPYAHIADGSPCWTKNCSIPNNAAPQTFDSLPSVSAPPTAHELATFAAWLDDPDDPAVTAAAQGAMWDSIRRVEPPLVGQTWASVDQAKLHAMFEDAYQERLHILEQEEQDAYLYHMIDADALTVEALSRYDEAADDGDIDAMRDRLLLDNFPPEFKAAAQTWLENRVGQDHPYDAQRFGVELHRQSFEEAYQAGITTALSGWTSQRRGSAGNPYDAEANGVFPQDNSETDYSQQEFYNKGVLIGLGFRAQRR